MGQQPHARPRRAPAEIRFDPVDNPRLARLCGPLEVNLRQIESALDVAIARRGAAFSVKGAPQSAAAATRALEHFYAMTSANELSLEEVQLGLTELEHRPRSQASERSTSSQASERTVGPQAGEPHRGPQAGERAVGPQAGEPHRGPQAGERRGGATAEPNIAGATSPGGQPGAAGAAPLLLTRRPDLHGRTPRQVDYIRSILAHDITFGIGPAGTGKTFLAVACAVDALERDQVQRIVLVRPAVEAGERLGFLPGDLAQKVDPYLRPLYDALYDLMGFDKVGRLLERGTIELDRKSVV